MTFRAIRSKYAPGQLVLHENGRWTRIDDAGNEVPHESRMERMAREQRVQAHVGLALRSNGR